ncbi:mitochondrial 54S ribosomal protein mL61 [Aspergillus ibericus CBS 121593]|uniref:50S ribosomal protein Mrp49 n=1 Tax=Aspergillus ibericus CBS 121593 TaxID=1448316 RepID=A0A395H7Y8_9EURO|nr:50S ribosomal protein Mrp49 [Aspergillus ibericus CBS 121593]RAL03780.1 50S ribosomal protein Mrp49 [Aspergillus ibericus CBS 121593]
MVNLFKRMRKLKTVRLLNIQVGTGAATFPSATSATKEFPAITRLHLTYARKIYGGHQGARHFWRNCLPRLKYYNPAVPMTVRQTDQQDGPAALTIYFSERASNAATLLAGKVTDQHAPEPAATEQSVVLDVKNLDYKDIWTKVKNMTGAQEIPPSAEQQAELQKLEQMRQQADKDRMRIAAIRQAKADQERMLQEARGEVEKLKQL